MGPKYGSKFGYDVKYDDETKKTLELTELTNEDKIKIEELKIKFREKIFYNVIEEFYIFHKLEFSTSDVAEIYGKNFRTIQYIYKTMGLNRTRLEAQQIAVKKRDYKEIRKTFKRTMLDRLTSNQLVGSMLETYIRHEINLLLGENLKDCEIIVGINSMNSIDSETDIPIIIIKENFLYKFIIEVDGILYHDSDKCKKRDIIKNQSAIRKGYSIFRLKTKGYYSSDETPKLRYKKEIKDKLIFIINDIVEIVNNENIVTITKTN